MNVKKLEKTFNGDIRSRIQAELDLSDDKIRYAMKTINHKVHFGCMVNMFNNEYFIYEDNKFWIMKSLTRFIYYRDLKDLCTILKVGLLSFKKV